MVSKRAIRIFLMPMFQAEQIAKQISDKNQSACGKQKTTSKNKLWKGMLPQRKRQFVSKKREVEHYDQYQNQEPQFPEKDSRFHAVIIPTSDRECQVSGDARGNDSVFSNEKKFVTKVYGKPKSTQHDPKRKKRDGIRGVSIGKIEIGTLHF